ncbi:MAG: hypothetical protein SPG61_05895 [Arcanobacterium sp.]|nr:hypothetical protein [Arcanobacterium sp.]
MKAPNIPPPKRIKNIIIYIFSALLLLTATISIHSANNRAETVITKSWRKSYDILVTAPDTLNLISPGLDLSGLRLIDPNFAAQTLPKISNTDYEKIKNISEVEVAAPVGFVGRMTNTVPYPTLVIDNLDLTKQKEFNFEITWQISTTINEKSHTLLQRNNTLKIDTSNWNGEYGFAGNVGIKVTKDISPSDRYLLPGLVNIAANKSGEPVFLINWGIGPNLATSIVAISPEEELKLLKGKGSFLKELIRFEEMNYENDGIIAEDIIGKNDVVTEKNQDLSKFSGSLPGNRAAIFGAFGLRNPFFGYVQIQDTLPEVILNINIHESINDNQKIHSFSSEYSFTKNIGAFLNGSIVIPINEEKNKDTQELYIVNESFQFTTLEPVEFIKSKNIESKYPVFQFKNKETLHPFYIQDKSSLVNENDLNLVGTEQSSRITSPLNLYFGTKTRPGYAPFEVTKFKAVDNFDPLLGIYTNHLLKETKNTESFSSSFHGTSTFTQIPNAIISLDSAEKLLNSSVISAIRVKVKNISSANMDEGLYKIEKVANQIRDIGLTATIVAGASSEIVCFKVNASQTSANDNYTLDNKSCGEYPVLGAASWTGKITSSSIKLLGTFIFVIAISSIFLININSRSEHTRDHSLLESLGWNYKNRILWIIKKDFPGIITFLVIWAVGIFFLQQQLTIFYMCIPLILVFSIVVSLYSRPQKIDKSTKLGTRILIFSLLLSEFIFLSITLTISAIFSGHVAWFIELITVTHLGKTLLNILIPMSISLFALLIIVFTMLFVFSQRIYSISKARINFQYWILGKKIRTITCKMILTRFLVGVSSVFLTSILIKNQTLFSINKTTSINWIYVLAAIWIIAQSYQIVKLKKVTKVQIT